MAEVIDLNAERKRRRGLADSAYCDRCDYPRRFCICKETCIYGQNEWHWAAGTGEPPREIEILDITVTVLPPPDDE